MPVLGTDRLGRPFEAQTAEPFEIGVKYGPTGARGMVTMSLFSLTMEGALAADPADTRFNTQSGKQRVRGVELEGKVEISPQVDVLASYAYSDSKVLDSTTVSELGREMLRVPKHQASAWVNYRPSYAPGLSVSGGVRTTSAYQSDRTYLTDLRIPGRAMVDLGAGYDLGALRG